MTISSLILEPKVAEKALKSLHKTSALHRRFCTGTSTHFAGTRRGIDPRVVNDPAARPDFYPEETEEIEEEFDAEAQRIEEMRLAFNLPKNGWFATDHTFIQPTEEPGIWRFGITNYMKAYFAYVYKLNITCSVGEQLSYMSAPLDIEFEAAGRAQEAVPDCHIFCPPLLTCYVQGVNWPLVHQPRKVLDDHPDHEWLLEVFWPGDPGAEENFVDGYPGQWMDTTAYVDFIMSLDPRDLYSRFPCLRVGDPALVEMSNYDGNTGDRIHKPTWKPDWWPWGF